MRSRFVWRALRATHRDQKIELAVLRGAIRIWKSGRRRPILLPNEETSYSWSMKQKTSITLSPETIRAVDEVAGETSNRSRVIEQAVLEFLERRKRQLREARDLEILDAAADELNREVADVLDYQAEL